MKTRVRCFGAFRKYLGSETHLEVDQSTELSVSEVKELIAEALMERIPTFAEEQLLKDSALANEEQILANHDRVPPGTEIALLPPVCGG